MTTSERPQTDAPPSARLFLSALHSLSAHIAWWHSDADISRQQIAEREEGANKRVVLALAGSAAFMTSLDTSIVNIALPSIAHGCCTSAASAARAFLASAAVKTAPVHAPAGPRHRLSQLRRADLAGRRPPGGRRPA